MPSKILIVDDDPALCEFIQEVLVSEQMQAHVVMDSMQAAARLREEKIRRGVPRHAHAFTRRHRTCEAHTIPGVESIHSARDDYG